MSRSLLGIALVLLAAVAVRSAELPQAPAPHAKRLSVAEIQRLIAGLGSEEFQERETATEALKRAPEAKGLLSRASRTAESAEVRQRVDSILSLMRRQDAEKRLARLPEYVKHRQLDRLVETLVAYRDFVTPDHDKLVRSFVKDVISAAAGGDAVIAKDYSWVKDLPQFGLERDGRSVLIARTTPSGQSDQGSIISEKRGGGGTKCVVLCNGDVEMSQMVRSVVIATGTVRLGRHLKDGFQTASADCSVIICLGDVEAWDYAEAVIVTAGHVPSRWTDQWINPRMNIIRENDKKFFGTWKLYSPSEAGATFGSLFGVVWVRAVTPDGPFTKAGVKPGDILTSIDGSPIRSLRDANRLLCRATVSWGTADLTIVRDDKKRDVIVTLSEW